MDAATTAVGRGCGVPVPTGTAVHQRGEAVPGCGSAAHTGLCSLPAPATTHGCAQGMGAPKGHGKPQLLQCFWFSLGN